MIPQQKCAIIVVVVCLALMTTASVDGFSSSPSLATRSNLIASPSTKVMVASTSGTQDVDPSIWAVASSATSKSRLPTQLNYRNSEEEELQAYRSATADDVTSASPAQLRAMDLPARRSAEAQAAQSMLEAELMVGRVAMVAAMGLLGTELFVGTSLPEQIGQLMLFYR